MCEKDRVRDTTEGKCVRKIECEREIEYESTRARKRSGKKVSVGKRKFKTI